MARDLNEFEQIAVAITAAMRNDVEPLKALLADLRAAGHNDYTIGEMFMSVGAIVFDEGDVITEEEEDMKKSSGELIADALERELDQIVNFIRETAKQVLDEPGEDAHERNVSHTTLNAIATLIEKGNYKNA